MVTSTPALLFVIFYFQQKINLIHTVKTNIITANILYLKMPCWCDMTKFLHYSPTSGISQSDASSAGAVVQKVQNSWYCSVLLLWWHNTAVYRQLTWNPRLCVNTSKNCRDWFLFVTFDLTAKASIWNLYLFGCKTGTKTTTTNKNQHQVRFYGIFPDGNCIERIVNHPRMLTVYFELQ